MERGAGVPSRTQVASTQSYTKTDTISSVPSLWPCHLSLLPLQVHWASPNSSQRLMHNLASASSAGFCLPHFSRDAPVVGGALLPLPLQFSPVPQHPIAPAGHQAALMCAGTAFGSRTCHCWRSQGLGSFAWHPAPLKTPLWARNQHREVAWVSQGLIGPHKVVSEQGSLYNSSTHPFHP